MVKQQEVGMEPKCWGKEMDRKKDSSGSESIFNQDAVGRKPGEGGGASKVEVKFFEVVCAPPHGPLHSEDPSSLTGVMYIILVICDILLALRSWLWKQVYPFQT